MTSFARTVHSPAEETANPDGDDLIAQDDPSGVRPEPTGDAGAPPSPGGGDEPVPPDDPGPRSRPARVVKRILGWTLTAVAAFFVFYALVAPNQIGQVSLRAFVRVPVEGLVAAAVLLVLPPRPRRIVAAALGVVLGLLTLVKLVDMGFYASLNRPFDLVLDWSLFGNGMDFVRASFGAVGEIVATVLALALLAGILALTALAVMRLARLLAAHRTGSARTVGALGVVWLACAVLGVQFVQDTPVASQSASILVYQRAQQIDAGLKDAADFKKLAAVDAFRDTPDSQLLTGLRGKNVVLTFIESYGRVAVENPQIGPQIDTLLDTGTATLKARGYTAKSGFLNSSTFGGGSWLAESTFNSGLWIGNQQRYRNLVSSDRLTITDAFRRAGFPTLAVMPGTSGDWPESRYFGFDRVAEGPSLGYQGPHFSWSAMPDQYTLEAFHKLAPAPASFSELVLTSSHVPWAPLPKMLDWNALGDGSVFGPIAKNAAQPNDVWPSPTGVRAAYGQSIQYSLSALISYITTYGSDNMVMVFLGDHQPAPIVSGEGATRDVPVTIVAHDPAVLDRVSSWGWSDGLRPDPAAPVWGMDKFRDKFLTAFGPTGH